MSSNGKRRRVCPADLLPDLLAVPGCTEAALHKVLGKVSAHAAADAADVEEARAFRKRTQRIHAKILKSVADEMPLKLKNGNTETIPVARLDALMTWFATECVCFAKLLKRTCESTGGEGLTLIWYADEVTPGNPLAPDNLRKAYLFYITCLEFGSATRSEHAWLPVALCKTICVDKLEGGLTRLARDMLMRWMPSRLFSTGMVMNLNGTYVLVKLARSQTKLLADYAADCSVWASKTASGIRPCLYCQNVVLHRSALHLHANEDGYMVSFLCDDPSKFDVMSHADYLETARELKAADARSKTARERAEISAGFNYVKEGLLQDENLLENFMSPTATLSDGMHNLFGSGGTINVATGRFVDALRDKVSLSTMQELITAEWQTPYMRRSGALATCKWRVSSLLNDKKLASTHYRGSASELLTLLPVLEWMAHELRPQCADLDGHFKSFLSACDAGREYLKLKRNNTGRLDATAFMQACSRQLKDHVEAYDEEACKPKHHLCFHVGMQADENNFLLDCWPPERKNHDYKLLVDSGRFQKLTGLEMSAYARLLNLQRSKMAEQSLLFDDHLGSPSFSYPDLQAVLGADNVKIASWLQANQTKLAVDDVILAPLAAIIKACVHADHRLLLVVKPLVHKSSIGNSSTWTEGGDAKILGSIAFPICFGPFFSYVCLMGHLS